MTTASATEVTGKDGGPVKVDTKTQHVFQPTQGSVGRYSADTEPRYERLTRW